MTDALERARAEAAAAVAAAETARRDAEAALARAEALATAGAGTTGDAPPAGPLDETAVDAVRAGYAFEGAALEIGALVNGEARPDVPVRVPLAMLNRHALVAGATGTGKTKTLQVLAEQLSSAGVPVFAADVKGDLSGIATPGEPSEKLLARTRGIGQDWSPEAAPTEFFAFGGHGTGVPVRATVSGFGSLLLSKVLGLNATQEANLGIVFHHAERAGLPLLDLADLRALLTWLTSDEGKGELDDLGGLSRQSVAVVLRKLVAFADGGADAFFGEPEIDTAVFLRTAEDGRGVVSLLELPGTHDQPVLYSTFLMWLLADLYNDLPEVGDLDRPRLVFFFDEAHLLFRDASKEFLAQITQTVRLIRSKGVGIVFVTQTPKDVPADVLAQLGSRVQHQLRAFTPDDAKALRATVSTYPTSDYDLGEVLTTLATGEAVVTVTDERGAPTPVAWTRLRAPRGSMSPTPPDAMAAAVAASPLTATYGTATDRDSAREVLARRLEAAAREEAAREAAEHAERDREAAEKEHERQRREIEAADRAAEADRRRRQTATRRSTGRASGRSRSSGGLLDDVLGSAAGRAVVREVVKGIFGTLRRR